MTTDVTYVTQVVLQKLLPFFKLDFYIKIT
jgi:hypothetical protein